MDEQFLYKVSEYLGRETLNLRLVFKNVPFLNDIAAFYNNRFNVNVSTDIDPSTYLRLADIIDHTSDHIVSVAIHNPQFVSFRQVFRVIHRTSLVIRTPHDPDVKALFDTIAGYETQIHNYVYNDAPDPRVYDENLLKLGIDLHIHQITSFAVPFGHIPPPHLFDDYVKYMYYCDVVDIYRKNSHVSTMDPHVSPLFEALKKLNRFSVEEGSHIPNGSTNIDGFDIYYHGIKNTYKNTKKYKRAILKAILSGRSDSYVILYPDRPTKNKLLKRVLQKCIKRRKHITYEPTKQGVDRIVMYGTSLETFMELCKYHHLINDKPEPFEDDEGLYDELVKLNKSLYDIIEQNTYDISEIY